MSAELCIVVPVSGRAEELAEVLDLVRAGAEATGKTHEIVVVVDGGQPERLRDAMRLAALDDRIRVLHFERAFGEGATLRAGLLAANAPIVLSHPGYFQTEGSVIPKLVKEVEAGADVAFASRVTKHESWFNRFQRWVFNATLRVLFGVRYHDLACGVRALRREALDEISAHGGWHRFVVVAAVMRGLRVTEVAAAVHPRSRRLRAYSPFTYLRRMLDVGKFYFLTKFVHKPLRFFGLIGAPIFLVGFVICAIVSAQKLFWGIGLGDRPLFMLGCMLVAFGFQILAIGLLAEIITYSQAKRTKPYVVGEITTRTAASRESAAADAPQSAPDA